jgi:ParB family chromosome partitioning protein
MVSNESSKSALGRGMQSILANSLPMDKSFEAKKKINSLDRESVDFKQQITYVPIDMIEPNPDQPRKVFDSGEIEKLSRSLLKDGVLQPLIVTLSSKKAGQYFLVAGERRLRASKVAGLEQVPVIVRTCSLSERLRIAIVENIQRQALNVIEEAVSYRSLIEDHGLSHEECALEVGKERATISNLLRLLTLPAGIQTDLAEGKLSQGHAKALLSLLGSENLVKARDIIVKKDLSVRSAELLCKKYKDDNGGSAIDDDADDANLDYIADKLRTKLQTKVKIAGCAQRGRIEISFFSPLEFERIIGLLELEN